MIILYSVYQCSESGMIYSESGYGLDLLRVSDPDPTSIIFKMLENFQFKITQKEESTNC